MTEHPVETELNKISGKTIVSAIVDWGDDRYDDSNPNEIKLTFSDGTHLIIHVMGWGDSELATYYYGKI